MRNNVHRRKQHEFFLLERFIAALGISAEIVEKERECPDFIIRFEGAAIGVEITGLYISHDEDGNTMQTQESISSRIAASARDLYEQFAGPPAHVTVCFSPGRDLRTLNRYETATALAAYIKGLNLSPWQRVDWRPEDEESDAALPDEFSFVHALGVPSVDMGHWGVARAGWVAPLSASSLQDRINEKAHRLPRYKDSVTENWLVVIADATKPSQLIRPKEDFSPQLVTSC